LHRCSTVTNGFEQLRIEACQARENRCVTAVVLAIVLIDLAHLARVGDDDLVTIRFDQTADPARVGTGFQRHARRREARELLINCHLRRLELSLSVDGSVGIEHAKCGGLIA
jgi:hypothetical protein